MPIPEETKEKYDIKEVRKKAEAKEPDAGCQCYLGYCYEIGREVPQDSKLAVHWYKKSAENGNMYAQHNMAVCYLTGRLEVKIDKPKAVELFTKAATQNHAYSIGYLGDCYYYGWGVPRDPEKAVRLYLSAHELGCTEVLHRLGRCYEDGQGVEQNIDKAIEWFELASDKGDSTATLEIHRLRVKKIEVSTPLPALSGSRHDPSATTLPLGALGAGVSAASSSEPSSFGVALSSSCGTIPKAKPKKSPELLPESSAADRGVRFWSLHKLNLEAGNPRLAAKNLIAAANAGHPEAQVKLGRGYLNGWEIENEKIALLIKNDEQAAEYFKKAGG